ncbi:hypothetical protein L6164_003371 [Bauhinia variegata]|uniref:Uncharacterized protein n=1 Tax=Bauhinia variegata TaxID=167791 RepID=A0ACB9Q133_BAUVA|nr:hypothetical protein L6164_003371 [Bauhinia variegata]
MQANDDYPSQVNRLHMDRQLEINKVDSNKKRKLQADQLDLLRPKHRCWDRCDKNREVESLHAHFVKVKTDITYRDDISGPESGKDSNSVAEDSDTAMSINEEVKLDAEYAKTCLYRMPSTSFVNVHVNNVKNIHEYLDGPTSDKSGSSEEELAYVDREYNPPSHDVDIQALQTLEEHFLGFGDHTDHLSTEYAAEDCGEQCMGKEFEDILFANGVNTNMYVLSSGRWSINQEAQSSARPPTIDQEFEEYFSMLML